MFTKHANQEVDVFIFIHWLLMSLCAGVLNAVAFIGLGTFATHVTGFATLFGVHVALSGSHSGNATAAITVPLFFLVGAIISGLCVEERVRRNQAPHYDYVMYSCSGLLLLACIIGDVRGSDADQTYLQLHRNFVLLSLLCLCSGLTNAALSYSSRATVRITHLTGVTTDLGLGIARMISLRAHRNHASSGEVRFNLLRALTIFSFVLGSVFGAFLYRGISFNALILPAAYFAYAGNHGRKIKDVFNAVEQTKGIPSP